MFTFIPELSFEELLKIKKEEQNKFGQLQELEIEWIKQKEKENSKLLAKKNEIKILEKEITELKKETVANSSNLDKLLAVVREREKRKEEFGDLQKKIEEEKRSRFKIKKAKFVEIMSKYNEIIDSEFGKDMKAAAWNSALKDLGYAWRSVEVGDFITLRSKVLLNISYDSIRDERDKQVYKTVSINEQQWMAKNLAYKSLNESWAYNNDENNVSKYGLLYSWEIAKNICPSGWHLPTKEDFETLLYYAGESEKERYAILKEEKGIDFLSFFSGVRFENGKFHQIGTESFFWSSSSLIPSTAWLLEISSINKKVKMNNYNAKFGFSVRCIKK